MADHLASIYGTEKDKVNCSFYFKIGACRHGERCSRKHVRPNFSQTVLLSNVYQNPAHTIGCALNDQQLQDHFDMFFEDMYVELAKYGEIEDLNVCDNVGDHLVGSMWRIHFECKNTDLICTDVYIMYKFEEDAAKAVEAMNDRFYAGRPLYAELSPVTDFGEACCRQYENSECTRGGFCNFMHLKNVTRSLRKELQEAQRLTLKMTKPEEKGDWERDQDRERVRDRERDRDRDRDRDRRRRSSRSKERERERRDRRDRGGDYADGAAADAPVDGMDFYAEGPAPPPSSRSVGYDAPPRAEYADAPEYDEGRRDRDRDRRDRDRDRDRERPRDRERDRERDRRDRDRDRDRERDGRSSRRGESGAYAGGGYGAEEPPVDGQGSYGSIYG
ncbi:hypothetical protein HK405_004557 [Cladochytrium tenue]|nr:hypothetical protein HK405_004557 [Cladochytrium tenue]